MLVFEKLEQLVFEKLEQFKFASMGDFEFEGVFLCRPLKLKTSLSHIMAM